MKWSPILDAGGDSLGSVRSGAAQGLALEGGFGRRRGGGADGGERGHLLDPAPDGGRIHEAASRGERLGSGRTDRVDRSEQTPLRGRPRSGLRARAPPGHPTLTPRSNPHADAGRDHAPHPPRLPTAGTAWPRPSAASTTEQRSSTSCAARRPGLTPRSRRAAAATALRALDCSEPPTRCDRVWTSCWTHTRS